MKWMERKEREEMTMSERGLGILLGKEPSFGRSDLQLPPLTIDRHIAEPVAIDRYIAGLVAIDKR
jgi:hypothetical protein